MTTTSTLPRRLTVLLAALVASAACTGDTTAATQIIVSITSDLVPVSELSRVKIAVGRRDGGDAVTMKDVTLADRPTKDGRVMLPITFSVVQGSQSAFRLTVIGYGPQDTSGDVEQVVEHKVDATFEPRHTLLLRVFLGHVCEGVSCGGNKTCYAVSTAKVEPGTCDDVQLLVPSQLEHVDADLLPDLGGAPDASARLDASTSSDAAVHEDGSMTVDVNECADPSACKAHSTCQDTAKGYSCPCDSGYVGDGKLGCMSLCTAAIANDQCDANSACVVQGNSAVCTACKSGYVGDGKACAREAQCPACGSKEHCVPTGSNAYGCACLPGYAGTAGNCMDIDECATGSPCGANTTCTNSAGGFACACKSGFEGEPMVGCTDIDECATSNGGCGSAAYWTCTNNVGAAPTCNDIDECASGAVAACGTGATGCTNKAGSYSCSCDTSFSGTGSTACAPCATTVCNGACVDLNTDSSNCGACGYAVVHGRTCVAGRPTPAWQPISTTNAPPARTRHAAAFLVDRVVVSGGATSSTGLGTTTVGMYSPTSDTWLSAPPLGTARCSHGSAIAAGGTNPLRVYVFGGLADCNQGSTVGPGLEFLDASLTTWTTPSPSGTPPASRYNFAMATTTFGKLFIFGGSNSASALSSGAIFDPSGAGAWSDASCNLAGCERWGYLGAFAVGTTPSSWGVVVWGGNGSPGGLKYDSVGLGGSWSAWTLPTGTPDPMPQRYANDGRRIFYLQSTGACPGTVSVLTYDRNTGAWSAPDTSSAPAGLVAEAATAWSGSELIAWSGACGNSAPVSVGGRYQPPAP